MSSGLFLESGLGGHDREGWEDDPGEPGKDIRYGYGRINALQGYELLPPPGHVGEIEGVVTDEDGEVISDAHLSFYGILDYHITTDDEGHFSLNLWRIFMK